jgi:hypothetical protein
MFTQKLLDDLDRICRDKLSEPDETGMTQLMLLLVAEVRSGRRALVEAAIPLEVLAGQIRDKAYTELTPEFQTSIIDATIAIHKALETHDTSDALADPNTGLAHCDKDHEAFDDEDTKTEYFECECHSDDHVFKFVLDPVDGDFYLKPYLSNLATGFWKRLGLGLGYIMGRHSKYGHWDEVMLDAKATERLHRLTNEALDYKHAAAKKAVEDGKPTITMEQAAANAKRRLIESGQWEAACAAMEAVKAQIEEQGKAPRKPRKSRAKPKA